MKLKIFDYNPSTGTLPGGCYIKTKVMKPLKQVQLRIIRDGKSFKISNRKDGAVYRLNRKNKGIGYFSSVKSELTYKASLNKLVYPVN